MTLFEATDAVPRPPGWNLIANSGGTQGWHLVDHTTPDRGVVTVCGITGRVVRQDVAAMIRCPTCNAIAEEALP